MCAKGKMPVFRERLNTLLEDSGETIVGFAKFLGTSRQSLGYYLNGERVPDALMLKQICDRCGVSADWLLGKSEVQKPDADLQAVCEYTGLNENAILYLHGLSQTDLEIRCFLDTLNFILTDEEYGHCLLEMIDTYMNIDFSDGYIWEDKEIYKVPGKAIHFHKRNDDEMVVSIQVQLLSSYVLDAIRDTVKSLKKKAEEKNNGKS